MAVYDNQLTELKNLLPAAKNILIALPVGADLDKLAAGLALYLSLSQQGKQVSIVSEDAIRVGQSHLFGVNQVTNKLPPTEGGNFVITLEGVVASDKTVPALKNLDWYPENNNLNLVFHVLPGQTFQPAKVIPHYQGSGFNLIFVVGAANLNSLGNLYTQNQNIFSGVHIVNIDNQGNTGFGVTNVVDTNAASISEIMASILVSLALPQDSDIASNLLSGLYQATGNLTSAKVNADTFATISNLLKLGAKKPDANIQQPAPQQQPASSAGLDLSAFIPQQPAQNITSPAGTPESFTVPTVVSRESQPASENQPSPEERPSGEGVITETPEPDWLTPKVFKGTSIG